MAFKPLATPLPLMITAAGSAQAECASDIKTVAKIAVDSFLVVFELVFVGERERLVVAHSAFQVHELLQSCSTDEVFRVPHAAD